jgi:hypothetical protein
MVQVRLPNNFKGLSSRPEYHQKKKKVSHVQLEWGQGQQLQLGAQSS